MSFDTYDHYGYAVVALVGTFVAAGGLLWASQRSRFAPVIRSYRGVSPPFVGVIGVLFALTLAFLGNDTWNAHDRALNTVVQEADNLRSLIALTAPLPGPIKAEVAASVRDYARLAVDTEWPLLGQRRSSQATADQLDSLLALLASEPVARAAPAGLHALMLRQVIHVRENRALRIALSQTHVNPLKWLGMGFLGFLTMITVAMIHVEQARAEVLAVLLFAAAAAPTAAIVLVQGNPFQQPTAVSPAPFAALLAPTANPGG